MIMLMITNSRPGNLKCLTAIPPSLYCKIWKYTLRKYRTLEEAINNAVTFHEDEMDHAEELVGHYLSEHKAIRDDLAIRAVEITARFLEERR